MPLCLLAKEEKIISLGYEKHSYQEINRLLDSFNRIEKNYPGNVIKGYEELLSISTRIHYRIGVIRSLFGIGICYLCIGDYQNSIPFFKNTILLCHLTNSDTSRLVYKSYIDLSSAYSGISKYDSAAYFAYKSLAEINRRKLGNTIDAAYAYLGLADVWNAQHQDDKALYNIRIAEHIARNVHSVDDKDVLYLALTDEETIYFHKQNYQAAKQCNQAILNLIDSNTTKYYLRLTLSNMGEVFSALGQPALAIPYYEKAMKIPLPLTNKFRFNEYLLMGIAWYQIGKYNKAQNYIELYLNKTKQYGLKADFATAYYDLAAICASEGNFKQAFIYQRKCYETKDSLIEIEKTKQIGLMEMKYQTAKKDKEIADKQLLIVSQSNKLSHKNVWLVSITALSLLTIILVLVSYIYRQRSHAALLRDIEQQKRMASLQSIMQGEENERTRIARDLHDGIGGMLASLNMHYSILKKQVQTFENMEEFKEVQDIINSTAKEVRTTAHNLLPDILNSFGFAEALRIFCQNMQSETLHIDFECLCTVDFLSEETELSLYRILQELVHNVVKHAGATQALVQVSIHDNILTALVEDNGTGIKDKQGNGIGLANVRLRMEALGGSTSIITEDKIGTSIYLELPYVK